MGLKDQGDGTGHILGLEPGLEYLHVPGAERAPGAQAPAEASDVGAQPNPSSSSSAFSEDVSDPEDDPGSHSPELPINQRPKVEFALKLGYPEDQVLLVLRKLGPDALTNDVLGELVKFGTRSYSQFQRGAEAIAAAPVPTPLCIPDPCRPLCPGQRTEGPDNLRPVVVDGSNVAMSHGNKEVFSCQGIQLAVDWFMERGHRDITVFVPAWRKEQSRPDALISEQETLRRLEKQKILVFTPSRRVQGRRVVCYDDRFIVKLAFESDGIIVSNDNYRDLANEKPEWKRFIDQRLLMFSFVNDKFMPPDDPLGRHGPSLDNFLRKRPVVSEHRRQLCPYGKKCTYGHKCKFYHPERGSLPQRAVADELRASVKMSSVSKSFTEEALTRPGQIVGEEESPEHWQSTPKKQSSCSLRGSLTDLYDVKRQIQSRRGSSSSSSSSSNSSSSSGCSSFLGYNAPPSPGSLDRWDVTLSSEVFKAIKDPRCESPEAGYSSMVKVYSGLSLDLKEFPTVTEVKPEFSGSDDSSSYFSPDLTVDSGSRALPLHRRRPCHSVQHGLHQHSSQDMPKHVNSFEANLSYEETTSFQTVGVSPRGRSQDYPEVECSHGFVKHPSVDSRSLWSIKLGFPISDYEEIPSSTSLPKQIDPVTGSVFSWSPQSCQGFTKRQSQREGCGLEESTSSAKAHTEGLEQTRPPPAFPSGLSRQKVFRCLDDPPLSFDGHAPDFRNFHPERHQPSPQGYPHGFETTNSSFVHPSSLQTFSPNSYISLKGFSGEHRNLPPKTSPMSSAHPRPVSACSRTYHLWETAGVQEYNPYSLTSVNNPGCQQPHANWRSHSRPPHKLCNPFAQSRDVREEPSSSLWSSPRGVIASPIRPSMLPVDPALGQYRDMRERLFFNLCGIFPPDLVRLVMARNPHLMDSQEIAAAILSAKSQGLA